MSVPWNTTFPESGGISPLMRFTSVVFPAPFDPMRASTSPSATVEVHVVDRVRLAKGLGELLRDQDVWRAAHDAAVLRKRGKSRIAVPTMPAGSASTRTTSTMPRTICQYTVWPTA